MKIKKIIIIILIITGIIGSTIFFLRLKPVGVFLWKHSKNYEEELDCFTIMPYKCGHQINGTDEDILNQIKFLKITREEAHNLIIDAQEYNSNYLRMLEKKNILTEDEKEIKALKEGTIEYHKRVLRIIDEIE